MSKKAETPSDPGMILTAEEMRIVRYMAVVEEGYAWARAKERGLNPNPEEIEKTAHFYAFEQYRRVKENSKATVFLSAPPRKVWEVGAHDQDLGFTIVQELLPGGTFKVWRRRGDELLPEHLR